MKRSFGAVLGFAAFLSAGAAHAVDFQFYVSSAMSAHDCPVGFGSCSSDIRASSLEYLDDLRQHLPEPSPYFCIDKVGKHIKKAAFSNWLKTLVKTFKHDKAFSYTENVLALKITVHAFRKSLIVNLYLLGFLPEQIRTVSGHAPGSKALREVYIRRIEKIINLHMRDIHAIFQ